MLKWGIRHKSWLLPLLTILVIVYVSFFVGRYMDEFLNFHYLANDNPAYKATEGTFLGYKDPMLYLFGKYEYKMSFYYVGKTSSFLFYPFYKIFPLETALAIYNLVFYFILCWLLKVACRWKNWQVWAFAFAYPVLFAFLHDGGPLKVSALAFPLTALAFQTIIGSAGLYKKVFVSALIGVYWCIALEDKIFFLYLLPSVILFALSTVKDINEHLLVLKKNIAYLIIPVITFFAFAFMLLSAVYYSPQCLWTLPASKISYVEALRIFSGNQEGGLLGIISHSAKNIWLGISQGHYFRLFYYFLFSSRAIGIPPHVALIAKAIAIGLLFSLVVLMFAITRLFIKEYKRANVFSNYNLLFIFLSVLFFVLMLSLNNIYKYNGHHFFFFWILLLQLINIVNVKFVKTISNISYYTIFATSCFFYLLMFISGPRHNTSSKYHSIGVKNYLDSLNSNNGYAINFSSLVTSFYSERLLEQRNEYVTQTLVNIKQPIPLSFASMLQKKQIKILNLCWNDAENENLLHKLPIPAKSKLLRVFYNEYELRVYELDFGK